MIKTGKGFTILELMVVVILLGVIAAFGIPNYDKAREKSDEREAIGNLSMIAAIMEDYQYRNSGYPAANMPQVGDINTTLNMNIIEHNMDYSCVDTALTFTCTAVSPYGWSLDVSETSVGGNPRCAGGACPTCVGGGC